jgi:hypothetical protein
VVTRVIALGVALGLTVAGCSDIRRQATDALDSVASQAAGAPSKDTVERWNTDELTKALTAINDKIGASPADYLMFTISGYTSVAVQAIDPKKRENVDEYRYDGSSVKSSGLLMSAATNRVSLTRARSRATSSLRRS